MTLKSHMTFYIKNGGKGTKARVCQETKNTCKVFTTSHGGAKCKDPNGFKWEVLSILHPKFLGRTALGIDKSRSKHWK